MPLLSVIHSTHQFDFKVLMACIKEDDSISNPTKNIRNGIAFDFLHYGMKNKQINLNVKVEFYFWTIRYVVL